MTSKERDMMAEGTARRIGAEIAVEGAVAGASTAMSTVIHGPDGYYTVAVTILVQKIEVLPQGVGGE